MDYLLIWKNKGFSVVLYLLFFGILVLTLSGVLDRNIGGIFSSNYSKMILTGIILILSGIASLFTDNYTFEKGKFVKEDFQINELFFLSMKTWGYGLIFFGILNIIGGILES